MTHTTTRDALLMHYKATRVRLGDPPRPARHIIPLERLQLKEPPQATVEPDPTPTSAPVELPKEGPPKVANGITITKIPPRQSRLIIETTAEKHGLTVDEIMARSRKNNIVAARHEAFYLLRQAGYSCPQIGRFFGGMDHTTALHGALKHEAKLKAESEAKNDQQRQAVSHTQWARG